MSELHAQALRASTMIDPAEMHGLVCGLAAARPTEFSMPDFIELAGADVLTDETTVQEFVTATLDQLHAQDMEFVMLIPGDEELISTRMESLASWSAAFLSGFGAGLATLELELRELPQDVQEILKDLTSISALDFDVDDAQMDNEDEASFMELYEYVRVGAVLTLTLMDPEQREGEVDTDSDGETLH